MQEHIRRSYSTAEALSHVIDRVHGSVLDYGCGTGKYRSMLLSRGTSYDGMDIDPTHATIVGDAHAAPIADASYDTVVSNQVLEHVKWPWIVASEMARVLKPGGTCIVTAPFMAPYHAHPHDYFRYTEEGMRSLLEQAGLEVELCSKYGGFFAVCGETVKQRFFSPYVKHSRLNRFLKPWVERVFFALHGLCPAGVVYCNVLCVASKPLPPA